MTWTDERVAILKKLWLEGLSASQIAAELSGGVTRNAVIGKVHRLKLSGRAKPTTVAARPKAAARVAAPEPKPVPQPDIKAPVAPEPKPTVAAAPVPPRRTAPANVSSFTARPTPTMNAATLQQRRAMASAPVHGNTALAVPAQFDPELEIDPETGKIAELFIPLGERLSLLQLTERTCKWPIGDPVHADFHFCGRLSEEGKPYCEFHSRRAYHQLERRKR